MKILMVSSYFDSHKGGLDRVAGALFREFAKRGREIVWMAADLTPPPDPLRYARAVSLGTFDFIENRFGLPFPIPTMGAMRKIAREVGSADVLLLHDCLYLSNMVAFLAALRRGIPTIILQHISFVPYKNSFLSMTMNLGNTIVTKPMLSRASQVVYYSETTREYFSDLRFKRAPEFIPNGVDTDMFRMLQGAEAVAALRHKYGLPEAGPVILFAGRFVEKKGMLALKHMVELRPGWMWVFAGQGPLDPGNWNVPNVRVFRDLGGASLAPLYRACDLLVLPSVGEGFPLVVQEALSSGLPVVCGKESQEADPEVAAYLRGVPVYPVDSARTAREFLVAIEEMIISDVGRRDKAEQRRAAAVSRYSWPHAADRYLEIIEGLLPKAVNHTSSLQHAGESEHQ